MAALIIQLPENYTLPKDSSPTISDAELTDKIYDAADAFSKQTGLPVREAEQMLRRHYIELVDCGRLYGVLPAFNLNAAYKAAGVGALGDRAPTKGVFNPDGDGFVDCVLVSTVQHQKKNTPGLRETLETVTKSLGWGKYESAPQYQHG